MNTIELNSFDWELVVDLEEGRINSLKNKGTLLLGSFERIDGKKGSTHINIPAYDSFLKDIVWKLVEKSESEIEVSCENNDLEIHQFFSFSNEYFIHKVKIKNNGEEEKISNVSISDYWSSELGWQGLMFNGFDLSLEIKQSGFANLRQLNELNIPGKPLIKWQLMGFNYARLWTGFLEENSNKIFDTNYVCIEPMIGKNEDLGEKITIPPKMEVEVRQMIGVVYRT